MVIKIIMIIFRTGFCSGEEICDDRIIIRLFKLNLFVSLFLFVCLFEIEAHLYHLPSSQNFELVGLTLLSRFAPWAMFSKHVMIMRILSIIAFVK